MDTFKGVLLILVMLFAATTFVFYLRSSTAQDQVGNAIVFADNTKTLLKNLGSPCGASTSDFIKMNECVGKSLVAKDFKEETFKNYDAKTGEGYLVIKNMNKQTYESGKFLFYKNRVKTQAGCTLPGTIDPNVVCRFNFDSVCEDGDVLEVTYLKKTTAGEEEVKVFAKNC